MRKNLYPQEKISDPQNTHKANLGPQYPQETILDSQTIQKDKWHNGTKPIRPTMAHSPQNVVHPVLIGYFVLF